MMSTLSDTALVEREPPPDVAWSMQTVPRVGAPPLRFKGVQLAARNTMLGQEQISVALWARKKGDMVLAFSTFSDGAAIPDAIAVADQSAAAAHLEGLCELALSNPPTDLGAHPFRDLVAAIAHHQAFAQLVGEALAEWDALNVFHPLQ